MRMALVQNSGIKPGWMGNKPKNYWNRIVINSNLNSNVKSVLSRKKVDVTPVQNTGIKRYQSGIFNFNSMFLEVYLIIS